MALTISGTRYQEIRRMLHEKQIAREAAEIVAETSWDTERPAFSDVDEFLSYLDKQATPEHRPARSRRKRR
jgi:hypothetical protein